MNNRLSKPKQSLERIRYLRELRKFYGVNAINLVVSDVESNWLENWKLDS